MESRSRFRWQSSLYVAALAIIASVLVSLWDADDPKEYRGTLRYRGTGRVLRSVGI